MKLLASFLFLGSLLPNGALAANRTKTLSKGGLSQSASLSLEKVARVMRTEVSNMYANAERHPSITSPEALEAFGLMVPDEPDADRTVHLVVLEDVYMQYHEPLDFRTYQLKTISTGGLSFPGTAAPVVTIHRKRRQRSRCGSAWGR